MKGNACLRHIQPRFNGESHCQADRNQELFINLQAFKDSCKLKNKYGFDDRQQRFSP